MQEGIPVIPNDIPSVVNGDNDINGLPVDRLSRQYHDIIFLDDTCFEGVHPYDA